MAEVVVETFYEAGKRMKMGRWPASAGAKHRDSELRWPRAITSGENLPPPGEVIENIFYFLHFDIDRRSQKEILAARVRRKSLVIEAQEIVGESLFLPIEKS